MAIVIPFRPFSCAVDQLRKINRLDLRQLTASVIRSELAHGRDGLSVTRQLQQERFARQQTGGAA
ncbi:MAG: hypothetical protein ABIP44_02755 [Pseudoxanthomonas sp.]